MTRNTSLKKLREILILRHAALRQAMLGDDSLMTELHQNSGGDVVDFACDSAYGELSSQLAEVENRELTSIENALQKMKDAFADRAAKYAYDTWLARKLAELENQ